MNVRPGRVDADRTPILLGCVGALVMSMLSCCVLSGLAMLPALSESIPPPPVPDATRPDLTIVVEEYYLNRAVTEALPGGGAGKATLDVQPGNLLVTTAKFDLLLAEVEVVVTVRLTAEDGQVQLTLVSAEAGGEDLLELLGVDADGLTQAISGEIQRQIEAGLGEGARLLGIATDEERIIITARWEP